MVFTAEDGRRQAGYVRAARDGESEGLYHLFKASVRVLGADCYSPEQLDSWCRLADPERIEAAIQQREVIVAEADGITAGFAWMEPGGEVEMVFVHPDHARRGIGAALMSALQGQARSEVLCRLHLRASLNAVPFYLACGFMERRHIDYTAPDGMHFHCVLMEKPLEVP